MQVDTHRERLSALGLDSTNYRALLVMPIVYVAWADGYLFDHAKRLALEVGKEAFSLNAEAMKALDSWLTTTPSTEAYQLAFEELRRLVRAVDEPQFDDDMIRLAIIHAEAVARGNVAVPDARGTPLAVSPAEQQALRQAAEALNVDLGSSWAAIVGSISGNGQPSGEPLSGEDHEVDEGAITARFDSSRRSSSPPPPTEQQPPLRHLSSALRTKRTEEETTPPPQIKGGKL